MVKLFKSLDEERPKANVYLNGIVDLDAEIYESSQVEVVKLIHLLLEETTRLYRSIWRIKMEIYGLERQLKHYEYKKHRYDTRGVEHVDVAWFGTYDEVCETIDNYNKSIKEKEEMIVPLNNLYNEKNAECKKLVENNRMILDLQFDMCEKDTYKLRIM